MRWLLVVAVGGCVIPPVPYTAPVLAMTPADGAYGTSLCSWNNLPFIMVQPEVLASPDAEIIIAHEQVHAKRMKAYRGGCWPFVQRYVKDTAFQRVEEMAAYCEMGRVAIAKNRNPEEVWSHVKGVMLSRHNATLTKNDNCLFEER